MRASYPTYKSTSIPWLPEMPEHWDALKAKHIFKERSEKGYPNEPLLAATQTKGVVRKEEYETRTVTAQKDFHLLKLVKEEDFVISLRSFQGGIEYAYHGGIISPAYTIFYERNKVAVNKAFYRHLFKSHPFINSLTLFVTGIREGQNIDYAEFKDSLLPFPPLTEQTAIANYLDAKTEKINRFIAKKEKLIALLKEKKDFVINRLVTNGIDFKKPNDDGWKVWKLSRIVKTKITDGPHETPVFVENGGIPFVSAEAAFNGKIDLAKRRGDISIEVHKEYCKKVKPQREDIFIVKSGSTTGKVVIVDFDDEFSVWSPLALVRANNKVVPEFLFYSMQSQYFQTQVQLNWSFGTQPNIGMGIIEQLKILLPTSLNKQIEIVKQIKLETKRIDEAVNRIEKEIEKVKELKQSLIAEVVTGQIKVV
jgi:type I restriction enzyme S subunit